MTSLWFSGSSFSLLLLTLILEFTISSFERIAVDAFSEQLSLCRYGLEQCWVNSESIIYSIINLECFGLELAVIVDTEAFRYCQYFTANLKYSYSFNVIDELAIAIIVRTQDEKDSSSWVVGRIVNELVAFVD